MRYARLDERATLIEHQRGSLEIGNNQPSLPLHSFGVVHHRPHLPFTIYTYKNQRKSLQTITATNHSLWLVSLLSALLSEVSGTILSRTYFSRTLAIRELFLSGTFLWGRMVFGDPWPSLLSVLSFCYCKFRFQLCHIQIRTKIVLKVQKSGKGCVPFFLFFLFRHPLHDQVLLLQQKNWFLFLNQ